MRRITWLGALAFAACSSSPAAPDGAVASDGAAPADGRASDGGRADAAPSGAMAVGEFRELVADGQGAIAGQLPTAPGAEYLLVLTSSSREALKLYSYEVNAATAKPMQPAPPAPPLPAAPAPRCDFARRLDEVLSTASGPMARKPSYKPFGSPPRKGDKRKFQLRGATGNQEIEAEAIWVDEVAVFWIDRTTQPAATIDEATLKQLADGFAKVIVPRERIYFGQESDVNGDGHIAVLMSPLVTASAVAYVSPCDLVDPGKVAGCPTSNGLELVYLSPPSSLQPPYNTAAAMLETIAHEFQHAIYFYRKYLLNGTTDKKENPYITEGLSGLAQDLSGYQAGNFYVVQATLAAIGEVAIPNVTSAELKSYVPGAGDGIMRGAGYLLLRYLFDQAGGDAMEADGTPKDRGGIKWLRAYMDRPALGDDNLDQSFPKGYEELVLQFWTAMALSNRGTDGKPLSGDARFNFLPTTKDPVTTRQRGCNLFTVFHGQQLTGPKVQGVAAADGKLRAGGAELLRLEAGADAKTLQVQLKVEPAAKARLRVVRVK